jgi:hypothetical protein
MTVTCRDCKYRADYPGFKNVCVSPYRLQVIGKALENDADKNTFDTYLAALFLYVGGHMDNYDGDCRGKPKVKAIKGD